MTSVEAQQLQLLAQIKQQALPTGHSFLLFFSLLLPLPDLWKLNFYNFLISLPSFLLNPIWILIILTIIPFLFSLLLKIVKKLFKLFFYLFDHEKSLNKTIQLIFPSDASKSAYATEQLYTLLHTLSRQVSFKEQLIDKKKEYCLEIVSTKKEGIRYLLTAEDKFIDTISHNLLSYLPGIKIKQVDDYFDQNNDDEKEKPLISLLELKQAKHFSLSLEDQKSLSQNDPISYLTGNMTKLEDGEMISLQFVITPVVSVFHQKIVREIKEIKKLIYQQLPLVAVIEKSFGQKLIALPIISSIWYLLRIILKAINFLSLLLINLFSLVLSNGEKSFSLWSDNNGKGNKLTNPYEEEVVKMIKDKIDKPLFETSIRLLVLSPKKEERGKRLKGLLASFGQLDNSYQSLVVKKYLINNFKKQLKNFKEKSISDQSLFNQNPILSISELSDLYHFPFRATSNTEGMVSSHSPQLAPPLSIKNNNDFDVVFGVNKYGGSETKIGLTDNDRSRHVYIIGQTGSGKSTIIFHMAKDDIQKGRGVAVIDPHGDLAQDLLYTVPKNRLNDCIYLNPFDISHPIGINLLELKAGLSQEELEQEKELVCESVISIFRRLFSNDKNNDAHRIEYILRNTIYTAFTIKDATIFTVYELLNNPRFQKSITLKLEDENLKNFWINEFGKAGSYQAVKMVSGVTAKIGRFLFSPSAKRILEQSKSTIDFDRIIDEKKILICNLAEGKLGEDTSQLMGTLIISKLQQALMRRVRSPAIDRSPFYLFVDEFQNFATSSFTKLLSGGRKFGLRLCIAQQSTAQQDDRNMVNVILANTGTIICFRTASPIDEELMLSQFAPYVKSGDIGNLPRFKFYLKLSAVEPEEPFSGETIPIILDRDKKRLQKLIETSRNNYAIVYKKTKIKINNNKIKKSNKDLKNQPTNEEVSDLT